MTNSKLVADYRLRARGRRKAVQALFDEKLYSDVVRECQEASELALKSLIRQAGHSVPMTHEVSGKLIEIQSDLPTASIPISRDYAKYQKISDATENWHFTGVRMLRPANFTRSIMLSRLCGNSTKFWQ